ncbi:hypothetical protein [Acidisphaera sp. L21]|uniref:hypothetical protein n=1 Tax=Acidisphaera sp. L21 TaxID=1641851 RepID=UPI00131D9148|nr:hypothetical protein [Acidisphaera sp. L21]
MPDTTVSPFWATGLASWIEARDDIRAGLQLVLDGVGPTTVVALRAHGGADRDHGFYLDADTIDATTEWAIGKSRSECNLYFQLNQPKGRLKKKAGKQDIAAIRAGAFVDYDAKAGRSLDHMQASLLRLPLRPSIVIASGGGFQPIWLFPAPMPATDELVRRVEALTEQMIRSAEKACGGKLDNVFNIDRILRLPFSTNFPGKTKIAEGRTVCLSGILHMAVAP